MVQGSVCWNDTTKQSQKHLKDPKHDLEPWRPWGDLQPGVTETFLESKSQGFTPLMTHSVYIHPLPAPSSIIMTLNKQCLDQVCPSHLCRSCWLHQHLVLLMKGWLIRRRTELEHAGVWKTLGCPVMWPFRASWVQKWVQKCCSCAWS